MIKKLNITIKNVVEITNFCSFIFIIAFYYLLKFNIVNFSYYKADYSDILLLIICLIHFTLYLFLNKDNAVNKISNEIFYLICAFIVLINLLTAILLFNDIIDIKYIKDGTLLRYSSKVLFSIITFILIYTYRKNPEVNIFVISKHLATALLLLFFITQSQTILYLLQGSVFLAIFPNLFLQNLHKIKHLWNNMLCFIKNIVYANNINNKHILVGALFSRLIYNVILVGIVEPLPLDNGGISNNSVAGRGSTPPDLSGGAGAPPRQPMPLSRDVEARQLAMEAEALKMAGKAAVARGAGISVPEPGVAGIATGATIEIAVGLKKQLDGMPAAMIREATKDSRPSSAKKIAHGPGYTPPPDYRRRSTAHTATEAPKDPSMGNGVCGQEAVSLEKIGFDGHIFSSL